MSTNDPVEAQQRQFERPPEFRCIPYFVQRGGETLGEVASQNGISPEFLLRANPNLVLRGGQTICIPSRRRFR